MTLFHILLNAALLTPTVLLAQNKPEEFSTRIPLATSGVAPYYRVTIPLAAYLRSTHADLRDLRVFNAAGQAVPFARLASTGSNEERTRHETLRWFPLYASADNKGNDKALSLIVRQSTDGTLVELNSGSRNKAGSDTRVIKGYVLDASTLDGRENVRALDIDWSGNENSFQLLDVEASNDLQNWSTLRSSVQLARLDFQGARIERRRIDLNSGISGRYLRLLWREPGTAPQLTAASVEQTSTRWREPEPIWSDVLQANAKGSEFSYRLPHALPVTRLRFTLPEGNVLLPVDILRPGHERQPAQLLTHTVLYRIENKGRQWTQDEVSLNGSAQDELIVRIDPRSGSPVQALPLSFALNPDQVVFLASGKPPFVLAVGNTAATNSALDASTLMPGFGSPQAPDIVDAVALAASEPLVAPSTAEGIHGPRGKAIALWSVLALGVAAMGAMAFQLIRQMKTGAPGKD